jgi:hypothetical protein
VNRARVAKSLNNLALFILLMFAAPLAISIVLLQADWREIALAFAAYWVILLLLLGGHGRSRPRRDEVFGWMMILTMFTGWIGVPLLVVVQRLIF